MLMKIFLSIQELIELVKEMRINGKELLTFREAVIYFGFTENHLYKLTQKKKIPFNKPFGKKIWFSKSEVTEWIKAGRVAPDSEIQNKIDKTDEEAGKNEK